MRSFATRTALLLAILCTAAVLPSASFTLLSSAQRRRVSIAAFAGGKQSREISNIAVAVDTTQDKGNALYEPSAAFIGNAPTAVLADIGIDELKENLGEPQAVDIVRDLDGCPLTTEYFKETMGITDVESYSCPENEAFRGLMSNACRVHLYPGGQTAFYKRIVFENIDHCQEKLKTAPHKLIRDAKSCEVVASFLLSKACKAMVEQTGVHIPKCYDVKQEPDFSNPMKSKFSFLFEDFGPSDGWYQEWLLQDVETCKAALTTYAKIHAFFWDGSSFWQDGEAAKELEEGIWKSGSYVQPEAQGLDQCKKVAGEWATKRLKFERELSSLGFWDNLGERLESIAEECGRLAHPFADDILSEQYKKYRTFTHGDPKQANLFFRSTTESEPIQVGLCDFQWSGFGLAASDIAHFLTSGVHADMLIGGGEDTLLRYYFDELQKYRVEYGAFETVDDAVEDFSYGVFIDQYETGLLDICRLMIAYTWARFTEPVEKNDKAGCARTMNKTSYNKSIPNVVWLLSRCDEIMKSRGV